jgi:pyruvate/2-oxoglutarate dehydrogenase complex dihydrolipoamide dehydrogenase (E3) component
MYDLVVIGGGSGGLHLATMAARVGAKVALIEKRRLGAESAFEACVPSKGLVQAARLVRQVRGAREFGIQVEPPRVDLPAVLSRLRSVSEATAAAHSDEALAARGIDVYHGTAAFDAYDTVLLDGARRIEGQRFVIATGSRPAQPKVPGLDEAGWLDDTSLWSLAQAPESLIVIGAGPIGMEFAQVFARFGSRVTVLADQDRVLPREDPEISGHVACMLTGEGVSIKRRASIEKIEKRGDRKVCVYKDGETGDRSEVSAAEILCASARLANVEHLNLEALGVHCDPEHGIEVDDLLQTHAVRVFAIGDVLLRNQYTHAAEREADVAFQNAVLRRRRKMDYTNLPWATFLDPEVATVGISEVQAKADDLDHRVFRVSYADVDRARIDGRTEGFAKVVTSPSGKILGATILGEEASLVLQQLVLAMDAGLGLGDLAETTQIYPTYARIIRELAGQFQATRLERGFMATALRFFYGFQPRTDIGDGPSSRAATAPNGAHDDASDAAQPAGSAHEHGH